MTKFWNFTNHPSVKWGEDQTTSAVALGGSISEAIGGMPMVDPHATSQEVAELAAKLAAATTSDDAAIVQGEASLCWYLTKALLERGVRVFIATTEREVVEHVAEDGTTTKTATFKFVKFRSLK